MLHKLYSKSNSDIMIFNFCINDLVTLWLYFLIDIKMQVITSRTTKVLLHTEYSYNRGFTSQDITKYLCEHSVS